MNKYYSRIGVVLLCGFVLISAVWLGLNVVNAETPVNPRDNQILTRPQSQDLGDRLVSVCSTDEDHSCVEVVTGTSTIRYGIYNPNGLSGVKSYKNVNYEQRVLGTWNTSALIEITSTFYFDTKAEYPVETSALPEDIRTNYLQSQSNWIQSDDPAIVSKALELVSGSTSQAQAVEAILVWVAANIHYDSMAPYDDALGVYQDRRAVCGGFSTLSTALLRAAGIPARYQAGCATTQFYGTVEDTGWHAWIEVYYPDTGWVTTEPQGRINWINPGVIFEGFDQCGDASTEITVMAEDLNPVDLYYLYNETISATGQVPKAATILSWPRPLLKLSSESMLKFMTASEPIDSFMLYVEDNRCYTPALWIDLPSVSWIPTYSLDTQASIVTFDIDISGLTKGAYSTQVLIVENYGAYYGVTKTLDINLIVADAIFDLYLPFAANDH